MIIYLVRKHSVEELVDKIKGRYQISKQTVINESECRLYDCLDTTDHDPQCSVRQKIPTS